MTKPTATFSFAGLSVEDAALPKRESGRTAGPKEPNPFAPIIKASYDAGLAADKASGKREGKFPGKRAVVPAEQVAKMERLIRDAGKENNCGTRTVFTDSKGARLYLASVGGEKKEGSKRATGGDRGVFHTAKPEAGKDKPYKGNVTVLFAAGYPKEAKQAETASA